MSAVFRMKNNYSSTTSIEEEPLDLSVHSSEESSGNTVQTRMSRESISTSPVCMNSHSFSTMPRLPTSPMVSVFDVIAANKCGGSSLYTGQLCLRDKAPLGNATNHNIRAVASTNARFARGMMVDEENVRPYVATTQESAGLYACSTCRKVFGQASTLQQHSRIHSGARPFACDVCRKRFVQKTHLSRHQLIHTGERPYRCEHCGKGFNQSNNLTQHRVVHSGRREHRCPRRCGKAFTLAGNCKKHAVRCRVSEMSAENTPPSFPPPPIAPRDNYTAVPTIPSVGRSLLSMNQGAAFAAPSPVWLPFPPPPTPSLAPPATPTFMALHLLMQGHGTNMWKS